jgi:hypothetical protein
MRTASLACRSLTLAPLLLAASVTWAQTELKNDAFVSGGDAVFMGGFVIGEIGASRFVPAGPCTITKLQLLFGGAATSQTVTVHIYDDSGEVDTPGSELMAPIDVQMTGSDSALQEVDLTTLGQITTTGPFRVGFEWQHASYPSIARDGDGNTYPDRNFIHTQAGWTRSAASGVTGDWVIRAFVDDGRQHDGGVPQDAALAQDDAAPPADASPQADAGAPKGGGGCHASRVPASAAPLALLALAALCGRRPRRG